MSRGKKAIIEARNVGTGYADWDSDYIGNDHILSKRQKNTWLK